MKILYFDCPTGASGNMLLASLIAAGFPKEKLITELNKLALDNFRLNISDVNIKGFGALFLEVQEQNIAPPCHRHLDNILDLINSSSLSEWVKEKSTAIFTNLAIAEAKVHQSKMQSVHFHEVGALDAIVDIVGTTIALDFFKPDVIVSSAIPLGNGYIKCQHGILPVPAPATLELIKGVPLKSLNVEGELTTPTGAAIISTLADEFGLIPAMKIESTGCGAGLLDLPLPNILRTLIGYSNTSFLEDNVTVIKTNIDDMNPEIFSYLMESLFQAGALDVTITPCTLKKGRPGHVLEVISTEEKANALCEIIFTESSSLGLRIRKENRYILDRILEVIDTPFGKVKVKFGKIGQRIVNIAPEFEDCQKIASANGIPLKDVYNEAIDQARNTHKKSRGD